MDRQFGGISGEVVNPRGCTKTLGEASAVKKPLPVESKIMKEQPSELETVHQFVICKNRAVLKSNNDKETTPQDDGCQYMYIRGAEFMKMYHTVSLYQNNFISLIRVFSSWRYINL